MLNSVKHNADSRFICIFAASKFHSDMDKDSVFNEFRKWFNQMFSLSFDGKFKGLSTLRNLFGARFIEHLQYKLQKAMKRNVYGYLFRLDVITMRISGHTIKLYNR